MKLFYYLLAVAFPILSFSCNSKRDVKSEYMEMRIKQKEHTEEMQHLVEVAAGLTGAGVRERYNALEKLRKEYPTMADKWDEIERDIFK